MGMVCVQRTLDNGRRCGLVSASGLTLAAAFWCVVAAQGLSRLAELVAGSKTLFTVALGLFLAVAGCVGLIRGMRPLGSHSVCFSRSLVSHFVSSFLGVILNPITFLTMTAVLAILGGIPARLSWQGMAGLALAFVFGGMTLWAGLTHGVVAMKTHLGERGGRWVSQILNGCILVLGLVYMARPFLGNGVG